MTRIINREISCPACQNIFTIAIEASINTWMDPELIHKIIDDRYYFKCPKCNEKVKVNADILINCPKGFFPINTGLEKQKKIELLQKYQVIDENLQIIPAFGQ